MTPAELSAIRDRSCTRKEKMGPKRARNVAAAKQLQKIDVHPYRCPFCGSWHVGHTPSMPSVETIAQAIRFQAYPEGGHIARAAG